MTIIDSYTVSGLYTAVANSYRQKYPMGYRVSKGDTTTYDIPMTAIKDFPNIVQELKRKESARIEMLYDGSGFMYSEDEVGSYYEALTNISKIRQFLSDSKDASKPTYISKKPKGVNAEYIDELKKMYQDVELNDRLDFNDFLEYRQDVIGKNDIEYLRAMIDTVNDWRVIESIEPEQKFCSYISDNQEELSNLVGLSKLFLLLGFDIDSVEEENIFKLQLFCAMMKPFEISNCRRFGKQHNYDLYMMTYYILAMFYREITELSYINDFNRERLVKLFYKNDAYDDEKLQEYNDEFVMINDPKQSHIRILVDRYKELAQAGSSTSGTFPFSKALLWDEQHNRIRRMMITSAYVLLNNKDLYNMCYGRLEGILSQFVYGGEMQAKQVKAPHHQIQDRDFPYRYEIYTIWSLVKKDLYVREDTSVLYKSSNASLKHCIAYIPEISEFSIQDVNDYYKWLEQYYIERDIEVSSYKAQCLLSIRKETESSLVDLTTDYYIFHVTPTQTFADIFKKPCFMFCDIDFKCVPPDKDRYMLYDFKDHIMGISDIWHDLQLFMFNLDIPLSIEDNGIVYERGCNIIRGRILSD